MSPQTSAQPGAGAEVPRIAPRHWVEAKQEGRKRGGNRGRGRRGIVRQIHAKSTERQAAWAETDQPNLTHQISVELDGLYGDLRDERKGDPGEPFRGRTSAVKPA